MQNTMNTTSEFHGRKATLARALALESTAIEREHASEWINLLAFNPDQFLNKFALENPDSHFLTQVRELHEELSQIRRMGMPILRDTLLHIAQREEELVFKKVPLEVASGMAPGNPMHFALTATLARALAREPIAHEQDQQPKQWPTLLAQDFERFTAEFDPDNHDKDFLARVKNLHQELYPIHSMTAGTIRASLLAIAERNEKLALAIQGSALPSPVSTIAASMQRDINTQGRPSSNAHLDAVEIVLKPATPDLVKQRIAEFGNRLTDRENPITARRSRISDARTCTGKAYAIW